MKTEFLKSLGLEDDAISKIMAENGKDIEKEKAKTTEMSTKLEESKTKISEYETKITELQSSSGDAEKFKTELETLKKTIADEKAAADQAAKEAKEHEEFQNRFNSVVGEQKWRDELTQNAVFGEFRKALADEANKGKGDKDILEVLTKDKNYFENPNKPSDMPGMGSASMTSVEENQMRAIMGLAPKE
ncbi:phage scaffolding protein [Anaerotignum sp.]|uniref:phage scaffolding protein n=1 Tax=Anaerotignum sp. TaxID=2039241 RepID=UPI0027153BA2|nr:phage scaffolding protein [Anaerotignum sp.]